MARPSRPFTMLRAPAGASRCAAQACTAGHVRGGADLAAGETHDRVRRARSSPGREALRRHPARPEPSPTTFYFHIDDGTSSARHVGGNSPRWINHACAPNCEADGWTAASSSGAARHPAGRGAVLRLRPVIDGRYTPKLKKPIRLPLRRLEEAPRHPAPQAAPLSPHSRAITEATHRGRAGLWRRCAIYKPERRALLRIELGAARTRRQVQPDSIFLVLPNWAAPRAPQPAADTTCLLVPSTRLRAGRLVAAGSPTRVRR